MCRIQLSFTTVFFVSDINHFPSSGRAWSRILPFPPPRGAPPIPFLSFRDHYPSLPESWRFQHHCFTRFAVIVCVCVCSGSRQKSTLVAFISHRSATPWPARLDRARGIITLFSGWERRWEVPGRRASLHPLVTLLPPGGGACALHIFTREISVAPQHSAICGSRYISKCWWELPSQLCSSPCLVPTVASKWGQWAKFPKLEFI